MAGLSVADIGPPERRYDPARNPAFETDDFAEHQDRQIRAPRMLEQSFAGGSLINRPAALDLGRRLAGPDVPMSLASSCYVRTKRQCVIGDELRLIDELGGYTGTTIHLVGENATVLPARLMGTSAPLWRNAMRTNLNRAMPQVRTPGPSFLIAFLHGEYNLLTGAFSLHWHGYACGDHLTAVEALRSSGRKFKAKQQGDDRDAIKRPVVIKREPITDLSYVLTYALKPYWPAVWSSKGEEENTITRGTRVHRIPEPYHSLVLLWLDRWTLGDITLLMGVRVTRAGLTLTNP